MIGEVTIPDAALGFIVGAAVVLVVVIGIAFKFGIVQFHVGEEDRRSW